LAQVKWTKEQSLAIHEKGNNILVAAAARKWKNSSISRKNNKQSNKRQSRHRQNSNSNIHKCSSK